MVYGSESRLRHLESRILIQSNDYPKGGVLEKGQIKYHTKYWVWYFFGSCPKLVGLSNVTDLRVFS